MGLSCLDYSTQTIVRLKSNGHRILLCHPYKFCHGVTNAHGDTETMYGIEGPIQLVVTQYRQWHPYHVNGHQLEQYSAIQQLHDFHYNPLLTTEEA